MTGIHQFALFGCRTYVSQIWYSERRMSKRERLFFKAKELISGDRAEMICQDEIDRYSNTRAAGITVKGEGDEQANR